MREVVGTYDQTLLLLYRRCEALYCERDGERDTERESQEMRRETERHTHKRERERERETTHIHTHTHRERERERERERAETDYVIFHQFRLAYLAPENLVFFATYYI